MQGKVKLHTVVIVMLVITVFMGRVMGMHAHGHAHSEHSHHQTASTLHDSHLVTSVTDVHDFQGQHGDEQSFEIDNRAIIKGKSSPLGQWLAVLLLSFCLILFSRVSSYRVRQARPPVHALPPGPAFKRPLLRAPPHLA